MAQHPPPAYDLQRSEGNVGAGMDGGGHHIHPSQSVDYSEATATTATGAGASYQAPRAAVPSPPRGGGSASAEASSEAQYRDSTETVREMHLALLHLLSNPEEFQRAASYRGRIPDFASAVGGGDRSTLASWNASYDDGTDVGTDSGGGSDDTHPPLPYLVFAEDAEVVLPQAHTASQLFGLERAAGIELEAAAGVPALSQLFLRWLALMPGGDHCSVIEPPGLTVMRIAGGRYRCTAAHRAVWTWSTEFLPEVFGSPASSRDDDEEGNGAKRKERRSSRQATSPAAAAAAVAAGSVGPVSPPRGSPPRSDEELHMGDLVSMTVVDVFETDTDGRLLSYCPTFDNRDIRKTTPAAERLRKGGETMRRGMKVAARSTAAAKMNQAAGILGRMSMRAAVQVKDKIAEEIQHRKETGGDGGKSPAAKAGTPPKAGDAAKDAKANGSVDEEDGEGTVQRTPGVAVDATGGGGGGGDDGLDRSR